MWGKKITISIYIEGDVDPNAAIIASKGAEKELKATYDPIVDFIGASFDDVKDKPQDQDAT